MESHLKKFLQQVKQSKNTNNPSILFATKYLNKYQFVSFISLAVELKISPLLIGENRVQDAKEKLDFLLSQDTNLRPKFKYIMIGKLQKNKIGKALSLFDEIHSVDSIELAEAISKRLQQFNNLTMKQFPIFLEVNIANDPGKHGFKPEELESTISTIKQFNNLTISGIMTMPPFTKNPESSRPYFRRLRQLRESLNPQLTTYNLQLSMGTSQDWQVALEEKADIIRLGSIIFK